MDTVLYVYRLNYSKVIQGLSKNKPESKKENLGKKSINI